MVVHSPFRLLFECNPAVGRNPNLSRPGKCTSLKHPGGNEEVEWALQETQPSTIENPHAHRTWTVEPRGTIMSVSVRFVLMLATLAVGLNSAGAENALMSKLHHSSVLHGAALEYESFFETFAVSEPGQAPGATITTLAYVRDGGSDQALRPVIFAFNGGPGAPSIYLNVGVLGPQRADLPVEVDAAVPPHPRLVPNEESILDVADLVLIDPVDTGLSRLTNPHSASYFHSVHGDATAVAGVIAEWSQRHQRTAAKKFLLGESYGAVRAVEVVTELAQTRERANLKGLVLLSQSLASLDLVQRPSNIVGQVAGIGTLAATAWYHKLAGVGEPLATFVQRAQQFGVTTWLPALFSGRAVEEGKRRQTARGLAGYTGLPESYFLDHDLYLSKDAYRREALARKGLILGAADTRYVSPASAGVDPASVLDSALLATTPELLHEEFGLQDVSDYRSVDGIDEWIYVQQPFDPTSGRHYAQMDYAAHLLAAMKHVPDLSLFVAGGWFDTHASVGADDYLVTRPGLDPRRVTARHYFGGHMFYTDAQSRVAFANDLRCFVSASRQRAPATEASAMLCLKETGRGNASGRRPSGP